MTSLRSASPTRRSAALLAPLVGLFAVHCGATEPLSEFPPDAPPCTSVLREKCGQACDNDDVCPEGLYCGGDMKCTADCAPGAASCAPGVACSPHGRCGIDPIFPPGLPDGGGPADGSTDGTCADVFVQLTKVQPTVLLLVDQSSSMCYSTFENDGTTKPVAGPNYCQDPTSRWMTLKNTLIGSAQYTGIVKQFEGDVEFGMTLYSGSGYQRNGDPDPSLQQPDPVPAAGAWVCPRFNNKQAFAGLSFALNNDKAIDDAYRPLIADDDTPTGEAMLKVAGVKLDGTLDPATPNGLAALKTKGPKTIVLATDGEPALCGPDLDDNTLGMTGTQAARDRVRDAAAALHKASIKTYVISIGPDTNNRHLNEVAYAGRGLPAPLEADKALYYKPANVGELGDAFTQIILGERSCTFKINGSVRPGFESKGDVRLNGKKLGYTDKDGWRLSSDGTQLELLGASCETLKKSPDATLAASFPCGAIKDGPR